MPQGWTLVQKAEAPAAAAPGWTLVASAPSPATQVRPEPSAGRVAGDVLGGWWEQISPIPLIQAVSSISKEEFQQAQAAAKRGDYTGAVLHALNAQPVTTAGKMLLNVGKAHWDQVEKAYHAATSGRLSEAAGHATAAVLPVIGPMAAAVGERAPEDGIARTVGRAAGILTPLGMAKFVPQISGKMPAILGPPANPVEAAAVRFGEARGIPMDAATATGSQFLKNVQKRVGSTWGGANTAENAQRASHDALARVGRDLAADANAKPGIPGAPQTPVSAGESVIRRFDTEIGKHHADATKEYDYIRAKEQQQANVIAQVGGVRAPASANTPFTATAFAVDVADARRALQPMYNEMIRAAEISPPMGAQARALTALDRLMRGPDVESLTVVDRALSDLKTLDRQWEGPVKAIVKQLDARVRMAAAQAGPDVLQALERGRAATKAKYNVEEVRDLVSATEPGQVFRQLTANRDTALARLRAVKSIAPDEIPNVARGLLEDMVDTATAEGNFAHTDKLWADWQKLGGLTKRELFPRKGQVEALDNFFLLAKRIGANPNPSGTAATLNATQALAGIPAWAIAKVLYTPSGVRALTRGIQISMGTTRAAQMAAASQIAKVFGDAGVVVPMAAEDPQETPLQRGSR